MRASAGSRTTWCAGASTRTTRPEAAR
jgi:hypothetical protein